MSGEEEQIILKEFHERLQDVAQPHMDDQYLSRWLRARRYKIDKAEKMYREHLTYRKKMDVDNLKKNFKIPEVLDKFFPAGGFCGEDRDGGLVFYQVFGRLDVHGMMRSVKILDVIKFQICMLEMVEDTLTAHSAKTGKQAFGMTVVYDLYNFGMQHLSKPVAEAFVQFLKMFEANYPEILKKVIVVEGNWKEVLVQHIAPNQIPVHYGGTMTDPDGDVMCKSKIRYGGVVPESCYSQGIPAEILEQMTSADVEPGTSLGLEVDVKTPGAVLRWLFKTEDCDIGFGVYKQLGSSNRYQDMEEVVPCSKHNSHLILTDGELLCEEPGKYVVRFDNSYSWVRSKTLRYSVEVLEPTDESLTGVEGDVSQFTDNEKLQELTQD
ncbi:SEC14L2 [Branchiostoma lanceolatum]|uniref:SEC14L2 protein n=1 Tax=Branchiostoma lanceolatum TaxID=7740 RepID=A0A8J9YQT3_BRALA|nr:SEC14L2 [Branchiostoma lanceolatum]